MRIMSFAETIPQMRARTKTVTRRLGWENLKPGDRVLAVEKARGVKVKDRKAIHVIRCVANGREHLYNCDAPGEMEKEGFPSMDPMDFIRMFCRINGLSTAGVYGMAAPIVSRIEFAHEGEPT
jgi:hypothetical protein